MNDEMLDRHIQLIYSTVSDSSLWKHCLSEIALTINAKSGMLGVDDFQKKTNLSSLRYGLSNEVIEALLPYRDKDLWMHSLIKLKPPHFVTSGELIPQKTYLASELYDGFGRHFDLHHTIGIHFEKKGDLGLRMSFQRGKSQSSYEQKEVVYLNHLLPHIKQAINLGRRMLDKEIEIQVTGRSLDRQAYAVFIVDRNSQIINMNTHAQESLLNEKWIHVAQNKLSFPASIRYNEYCSAISSVTCMTDLQGIPGSMPFLVELNESPESIFYLIEISRFQPPIESGITNTINLQGDALAMITIRNLSQMPVDLSHRLKVLYKLSESEIDIAIKLANGMSPKQVAEERSRSIETVRTQIKQLTMKLDLKNTNQLIARVNQLSK